MNKTTRCGLFTLFASSVLGGLAMAIAIALQKDYLDFTDDPVVELVYGALMGLGMGLMITLSKLAVSHYCKKSERDISDDESEFDPDLEAWLHLKNKAYPEFSHVFYGSINRPGEREKIGIKVVVAGRAHQNFAMGQDSGRFLLE